MIEFLKKLFSKPEPAVVPKQPKKPLKISDNILEDIKENPWFLDKYPDFLDRWLEGKRNVSLYRGNINYIQDKDGKTYYKDLNSGKYFCDCDLKKPPKEVLDYMIAETTFTEDELKEKLND